MSGRNRVVVESRSRERRKKGGIYYSAEAFFFLSVTLYLARARVHLAFLFDSRSRLSYFYFRSRRLARLFHSLPRYLLFVWLQNWRLRINKTISSVLSLKIAFLLKKILSKTANSNVNSLETEFISIFFFFTLHLFYRLIVFILFCEFSHYFLFYSYILLFPILISLRSSVLFRSLFTPIYVLTPLFRIECRTSAVDVYTCPCPCIFHLTTLPECSFNDTSEKFNKRTKELFWDAGGRRNWKTNLGRIPLFASFSLIWFQPLRLQEISISTPLRW